MTTAEADETYVVEIPFQLYFSTEEPITIKEVTDSLLALERLSKRFPAMLEYVSKVSAVSYELRVERIRSGSLLDELKYFITFNDPEKEKQFREFLEKHPMGQALRWGGLSIIAFWLISSSIANVQTFLGNDSPSIQANHNTIINNGSIQLGITPEEAKGMVDAGMSGNKKKIFQAARDVLKPVQGREDASVQIPGIDPQQISYPTEALAEVPFDADLSAKQQDIAYENVLLEVRALDRDKLESGWWGVLSDEVGDRRLRLYFEHDVNVSTLSSQPAAFVDAIVTYRKDLNDGNLVPQHITVTRIYDDSSR